MLTFGSLFAGIGGFDLGFERAGMTCKWQVEIDRYCQDILARHWPDVPKHRDIRTCGDSLETVDLVCGGDPCPSRSLAKGNRESKHPDLSGYFLAVVARHRPRWVVRENVPAPDVIEFAACLELLGYGVVAFALDARDFTGQSRRRQFLVGCPPHMRSQFQRVVFDASDGLGFVASGQCEETPIAACLTAHPARMAAEDTYCYEDGRGLRMLDPTECEPLQGFPRDWTAGFSRSRRRIMLGNAVNVGCAEWIGKRTLEAIPP